MKKIDPAQIRYLYDPAPTWKMLRYMEFKRDRLIEQADEARRLALIRARLNVVRQRIQEGTW